MRRGSPICDQFSQFINPSRLRLLDNGIYLKTDESGEPVTGNPLEHGMGATLSGFLEGSNVMINGERHRLDAAAK